MRSDVDDDAVVGELGLFGAEYLPAACIPEDTRSSLPQVWIDAVEAEACLAGGILAEQWRRLCPDLPRIADLVERRTRRVVIANLTRRTQWTRCLPGQDGDTWAEPALVYLFDGDSGSGDIEIRFGWRPYRSDVWPAGSEAARGLVGRLFGELQDGFVDFFDAGLFPAEDWHSLADMPGHSWRFVADCEEVNAGPLPQDQSAAMIPAEDPASWSHVAVIPASPPSVWAGHHDNLRPRGDLAAAIDSLVSEVWEGAVEVVLRASNQH